MLKTTAVYSTTEFSEEEIYTAAIFSNEQTAFIRSELTRAVNLKLNLSYSDYPETVLFLMAQEYHRGFIAALDYLLANQDALINQYRDQLEAKASAQKGT